MYFFNLMIIVLCFLFLQTFGRPTHILQDYDKDSTDNFYRDSDSSDSDDYEHSDQKSSLKQIAGNKQVQKAELLDEKEPGTNAELEHVRLDKDYLENDEDQPDAAHLLHGDVSMNNNDIKRTATYGDGLNLYNDNGKQQKLETNVYNKDGRLRPSKHIRYLKHYNGANTEDKDILNRDRRQTNNNNLNEISGTDEISTPKNEFNTNEDEEIAIRRHVKKLSKAELDELLQSLSEEKRSLLKNIIENNQQEYDSISKREITKKAGANEENSFVGNEQSDTSKVQVGSANLEADSSMAPNFEKQDDTKKADSESMYSKSTETTNSSDKSNEKNNVLDSIAERASVKSDNIENSGASETASKLLASLDAEKDTPKKENKRETDSKPFVQSGSSVEEPAFLRSSNRENLYCSDNEAISQLWNEESNLNNDNKYKRETCLGNLESIKSLEESFPIAENSDNLKPGSNMVPLIRVKRNNPDKVDEKREANVVPNIKVPYFSNVFENNDEGNDEGGEFHDDGYFDRGASFVKSSDLAKRGTDISKSNPESNIKYCGNSQTSQMDKSKLETDTVGLGSDTDIVLSGIEGVDDNLMYNGVGRIRRTGNAIDNLSVEREIGSFRQENKPQLSSQNDDNEISEVYNNAARYQENDAFGSLPRNYEQDLGRFKRIRRLKQDKNVPAVK